MMIGTQMMIGKQTIKKTKMNEILIQQEKVNFFNWLEQTGSLLLIAIIAAILFYLLLEAKVNK